MSRAEEVAATRAGRGTVAAAVVRLWGYVKQNRRTYLLGTAVTLLYVATFVAVPLLVRWAVGGVRTGEPQSEIMRRCLWIAAVAVAGGLLRFLSRTIVFNAGRQIEYQIRNDLFEHLQRLPQSFFARWRTGDLMSRAVNDLNAVRLLLGPGLLNFMQTPVLFVAVLIAMFALDVRLALLVLVPYPLFIFVARTFGRAMHHWNLMVQEGLADLSSRLQETISGISVVKAYAMEGETRQRFEAVNEQLYQRHIGLAKVNAAMMPITGLLPSAAMWVVLFVGGQAISDGRMREEDFFAFAMYIWELTFPTFIMGWVFALVQRGAASMQRIDEVLSVEPSIADRPDCVPVERLRGEIDFRNLTFHYAEGSPEAALDGITLHVPAGSSLGVVGPVGGGKTTLASVIPRLFEVEDGQLFIDGIDVNRIPLRTLRDNIAMVPQDSFLFSMTLAENVAFGLPDVDAARVDEAVMRAQLRNDLAELPHGLSTLVGERGVMLSGGQRQRTALARALALRPGILILDDALSSVDAATEEAIQAELDRVFRGRTVVVVAHRISTVRGCDQIVVIEGGRISECGSHAELVAAGGFYARLARQQALEEELEEELEVAEGVA